MTPDVVNVSLEDIRGLLAAAKKLRNDPVNAAVGERIDASVVRPLAALLRDHDPAEGSIPALVCDTLWDVTREASERCFRGQVPAQLVEATAALQKLVLAVEPARFTELKAMVETHKPMIRLESNGPLFVLNVEDIHDWLGRPLAAAPITSLCRCGKSAMKPYCDGSHAAGFDDAKDPKRVPDRQDTFIGQQVTIFDNRGTCQHSGLCTARIATAFRVSKEPFVAPSGGRMDELIRAVRDCPSGALSYAVDGVEARADVDRHGIRPASIEVTKDGPYRVSGNVKLIDSDGRDVQRNAGASYEHFSLCRCGHAQNKPFCTGMHWYVGFHDPVAGPGDSPTMFEWAGGLPALTRMTRHFYEKHIPADDLLSPIFAEMSADHPERVAKWLAEVFGGPACYSEEYGGYVRMLSQHLNKMLTEEMRVRWVQLLVKSAHEVGLPNDPEFRSAFQAYIEWGTRLAVENSQHESKPPAHMPMPHWGWNTSAGPPGSRVSALAPSALPDAPTVLPQLGETVTFEKHVASLFRTMDRKSMMFAFDLGSYADVSKHAEAILGRVKAGTMPCDGAWPKERVEAFERWTKTGKTK